LEFKLEIKDQVFRQGQKRVEIWYADDFDPWETLRWETVRVVLYRLHKPHAKVFEPSGSLTSLVGGGASREIFRIAKSRWEIDNQGFNHAKNRYGFEHICHHEPNSLLVVWLLICLALIPLCGTLPAALLTSGHAPGAHRHQFLPPFPTQTVGTGHRQLQLRTQLLLSPCFPLFLSLPGTRACRARVCEQRKNELRKYPPPRHAVENSPRMRSEPSSSAFPLMDSETPEHF
jgi:hypothetical protein